MDVTATHPRRPQRLPRRSLLVLALLAAAPLHAQTQPIDPQQLPAPPPVRIEPETASDMCTTVTGSAIATPPAGASCAARQQAPPQQLPEPTATPQASFVLKQIVFKGATAVGDAQLQALVAHRIGQTVTFAELQQMAARVTEHYRDQGFLLAQAVLPVQEVQDGVVEISVVEGRLGTVTLELDPKAPISEARVRTMLAPLREGEPLNGPQYERVMLLLSDLPGLRVQSALEEGRQAGTTDLTVQIAVGKRLLTSVELDNYGTKEVGRERLGATLRWASPFGIGDNLDVRATVSNGAGTVFGRVSYEAPLGAQGLRFGMGASRTTYSLGGDFEILDAVGKANIFDIGLTYPLIRQRSQNLFLRGFIDRKDLTDELRAVDFQADKRIDGIGAGWAWERRDGFAGGGYWNSSGALYHGRLKLLDAASRAVNASIFGRNTAGSFNKLTAQFSRLQALAPRLSMFAGLGAQWTDRNLDASEKLALGGYRAVRAYPSGEVLVDEGAIANLELRYALNESLTAFVFYDAASGNFNHDPGPFDLVNRRTLRGPGIGLSYSDRNGFSANASVAWRTSDPAVTDGGDRRPRVFIHLQKSF